MRHQIPLFRRVAVRHLQSGRSDVLNKWEREFGIEYYPPRLIGPEKGPWTGQDDLEREIELSELPDGTIEASLGGIPAKFDDVVRAVKTKEGLGISTFTYEGMMENLTAEIYWVNLYEDAPVEIQSLTPAGQQLMNDVYSAISKFITYLPPMSTYVGNPNATSMDETGLELAVVPFFAEGGWSEDLKVFHLSVIPQRMENELNSLMQSIRNVNAIGPSSEREICMPEVASVPYVWIPKAKNFIKVEWDDVRGLPFKVV